jgi:hypothetical protein
VALAPRGKAILQQIDCSEVPFHHHFYVIGITPETMRDPNTPSRDFLSSLPNDQIKVGYLLDLFASIS